METASSPSSLAQAEAQARSIDIFLCLKMPSCSGAGNANNYDVLTYAVQDFISAKFIGKLLVAI